MRSGLIILFFISAMNFGCGEQQDIKVYNMKSADFLKFVTGNSTFEAISAEIVVNKGSNAEVKSFAESIILQNSIMHNELMDFAEASLFILPDAISPEIQVRYSTLSQLSGMSLDRKFADEMVLFHANDVAKFDSASRYADVKEIRLWAERYLPVLKSNLEESNRLDKLTDNL
jgi:putative membrane protein